MGTEERKKMPERSDGEFEFTLGNKQLFSVLFIVVVLLGLFFAMGFLAGRGTAPESGPKVAKSERPLRVDRASRSGAAGGGDAEAGRAGQVRAFKANRRPRGRSR